MPKEEKPSQVLNIHNIYVKDVSLETPGLPDLFKKDWQPEIFVDLDVESVQLDKTIHEVFLSITVTAKMKEKTVFLVEVQQAGIFELAGFEKEQLDHLLGVYAPTVLFPYVREMITNLITHAGLPQLNLAPVDFNFLMEQKRKQHEEEAAKAEE